MSGLVRHFLLISVILIAPTSISFAEEMQGVISYRTYIAVITLDEGLVTGVHANVGDRVSSGDALIEFDTTIHKARVTARQSVVDRLRIEVDSLADKFARQQEMFDRGSLSLLAYEETENALKTAEARLEAAQAKLSVAQHLLERTKLLAPINAVVLSRNIHPGMNVVPELQTEPLMVLASDGNFIVKLSMDFDSWLGLKNSKVPVEIDVNGKKFSPVPADSVFYPAPSESGTVFMAELNIRDDSGDVVPGTIATVIFQ